MEVVKGIRYRVNGHKDLNEFAQGILALVNVKSSRKDVILDFKTFEGSNDVSVTVFKDSNYNMKEYIRSWLGEIEFEEEIEIIEVWEEDLKLNVSNVINNISNNYFDSNGNDFEFYFNKDM